MFVFIGKVISIVFLFQIVVHFFPKLKTNKFVEYTKLLTDPVVHAVEEILPFDDKYKPVIAPFLIALGVTILARILAFII